MSKGANGQLRELWKTADEHLACYKVSFVRLSWSALRASTFMIRMDAPFLIFQQDRCVRL